MGLLLPLPDDAGHGQGRSPDEGTAQDAQGFSPEGISPEDMSQDLSGLEELLLPTPPQTPPPPTSSNSPTSAASATSPTSAASPSATSPMLDSSSAAPWDAGPSEAPILSRHSFAALASVRLVTLQIGDEPPGVAPAAAGSAGQLDAAPAATSAEAMATTPGACAVTKTERPSPASMMQTAIATGAAAEQPPTVVVGPEAEQASCWEEGAEEHPPRRSPEGGFHWIPRGTPLVEMTRRRKWAKTPQGLPPSSRPASSDTHRAATRAEGLPMPVGPPPSPRRHYMQRRGGRSRQRASGGSLTYSASE